MGAISIPELAVKQIASLADFKKDQRAVVKIIAGSEWPSSLAAAVCPECGGEVCVTDSRTTETFGPALTRRRRKCVKCGYIFTTIEVSALVLEALISSHQSSSAVSAALRDLAGQIEQYRGMA